MGKIGCTWKCEFYRVLGIFIENLNKSNEFSICEKFAFNTLGTMLDNSRNAVMPVETVKRMIRHLALMDYDTLMLYTEDTFEVDNYPYFGYMRVRFRGV
jgi:hexosaminidase